MNEPKPPHLIPLPETNSKPVVVYRGLPDEAAVTCVAELHERATTSGQAFRLMPVNHARHSRGLCIGISDSPQAIAVFYLSTVGDYGWCLLERLHVMPPTARTWVTPPIEVGMLYWFRASGHGRGHVQAEAVGTVGPLKTDYFARHMRPPGKPQPKTKTDDDGNAPALRPAPDAAAFTPLKSLDDLGL